MPNIPNIKRKVVKVGAEHRFGGSWTREKLERLEDYLKSYLKALKEQPFKLAYIDAFAGTGEVLIETDQQSDSLPGIESKEAKEFLRGSARIALDLDPGFDTYIFIDKDAEHAQELEKLKQEYPSKAEKIRVEAGEANTFLRRLCSQRWFGRRAVLFLDPYGMQVEWRTLESIAATKAIDLWLLFPLGVAVNRMLPRDPKKIPEAWARRLTSLFGEEQWRTAFYEERRQYTFLPDGVAKQMKTADFKAITDYFVGRLRTIFAGVSEPLPLESSSNNPLCLLLFAASNPNGADIALRIANHILKPKPRRG